MKTGIFIRVGSKNVDIADADLMDFKVWWDSLDKEAQFRTVRSLLIRINNFIDYGI